MNDMEKKPMKKSQEKALFTPKGRCALARALWQNQVLDRLSRSCGRTDRCFLKRLILLSR